jgi:hypothetical protein
VHGALDRLQEFSGLYASDGLNRFISVQTSYDSGGLEDHYVVFSFGAPGGEQGSFNGAQPPAGDHYSYQLQRMSDTNQFHLAGVAEQTLTVTAPAALTPGVVVGNCCDGTTPQLEAYVEWMMVCQ